jgi:hypothetical protein
MNSSESRILNRGVTPNSGDGQTFGTGVVLGEPGCAYEKEEGETALGLDGEKVFSPGREAFRRRVRKTLCPVQVFTNEGVTPIPTGTGIN